jgi:hypothetical protein
VIKLCCPMSCVLGIEMVEGERKMGSRAPNWQMDAEEERSGRQEE